jgi:peptidoglycan hydrolase-like protein with peptidoglycan-binding domain
MQVVINALFLQAGPHPAPMFAAQSRSGVGDPTGSVMTVAPRPRPADLGAARPESPAGTRTGADIIPELQRELERRGFYDGPIDGHHGPKTDGAIRDFVTAAGLKWNGETNDDLLRAVVRSSVRAAHAVPVAHMDPIGELLATSSRRMLAVQRALGDFGYGPVKPTGSFGPDTKAAIEKFERDRKMPATGQVSERLLRELAVVTGRPLE